MAEKMIGFVNISISDQDISYDSDFTVSEVVFWLDVVKAMIMNRVIQSEGVDIPEEGEVVDGQ